MHAKIPPGIPWRIPPGILFLPGFLYGMPQVIPSDDSSRKSCRNYFRNSFKNFFGDSFRNSFWDCPRKSSEDSTRNSSGDSFENFSADSSRNSFGDSSTNSSEDSLEETTEKFQEESQSKFLGKLHSNRAGIRQYILLFFQIYPKIWTKIEIALTSICKIAVVRFLCENFLFSNNTC